MENLKLLSLFHHDTWRFDDLATRVFKIIKTIAQLANNKKKSKSLSNFYAYK